MNSEPDLLAFDVIADFQPVDMLRISSSSQIFIKYGDYEPRQKPQTSYNTLEFQIKMRGLF